MEAGDVSADEGDIEYELSEEEEAEEANALTAEKKREGRLEGCSNDSVDEEYEDLLDTVDGGSRETCELLDAESLQEYGSLLSLNG